MPAGIGVSSAVTVKRDVVVAYVQLETERIFRKAAFEDLVMLYGILCDFEDSLNGAEALTKGN